MCCHDNVSETRLNYRYWDDSICDRFGPRAPTFESLQWNLIRVEWGCVWCLGRSGVDYVVGSVGVCLGYWLVRSVVGFCSTHTHNSVLCLPRVESFFVLMILAANSSWVDFWTHRRTIENAPLHTTKHTFSVHTMLYWSLRTCRVPLWVRSCLRSACWSLVGPLFGGCVAVAVVRVGKWRCVGTQSRLNRIAQTQTSHTAQPTHTTKHRTEHSFSSATFPRQPTPIFYCSEVGLVGMDSRPISRR